MENNRFVNLGKHFYDWYKAGKVILTLTDPAKGLDGQIERVVELIDYVEDKRRLKG